METKFVLNGMGEPGAQLWWCRDGDHVWGERPKPYPALEEPS
jgi:hypothetical protein